MKVVMDQIRKVKPFFLKGMPYVFPSEIEGSISIEESKDIYLQTPNKMQLLTNEELKAINSSSNKKKRKNKKSNKKNSDFEKLNDEAKRLTDVP